MVNIDRMIENTSVKHSNKIKKICEPLTLCFGINHFFLSKTMLDGRFFSIGSNLNMHQYYYCEKLFRVSPFHRNPSKIHHNGFYAYRNFKDEAFQFSIDNVGEKVDVEPIAGIIVKQHNSIIRFGYSTSPKIGAQNLLGVLNNNIPLLEKFNAFFMEEMKDQIDRALDDSIFLPKHLGSLYDQPLPNEFFPSLDFDVRLTFLKKIKVLMEHDPITKREFDYLKLIAKGLTSAQIAKGMNLSARTVENTIGVLKQKLGCSSKADLVEVARLF